MEHFLLIDNTGQLTAACHRFATKVKRVSIICRDKDAVSTIEATAKANGQAVTAVHARVNDESDLRKAIEQALGLNGPADVTIAALGDAPPASATVIAQTLRDLAVFTEYFDVTNAGDPADLSHQREGRLRSFENVWYRRITIGFIVDNGSSRWPNEDEVTSGIVRAVEERSDKFIIGQTEPQEKRPA